MKKSSKKIGIDIRLWNETGIGRYIRNLTQNLLLEDKKNGYVFFAREKDFENIQQALPQDALYQLVSCNIRWHTLSEQIEFPKILKKHNLDLVHFPYFSVPIFYKGAYIVTVHDLIINHFPTGRATTLPSPLYKLKRIGYEYVLKKSLKDAKKILVPSTATKNEIEDHYKISSKKIIVTPEGVDDSISDFEPDIFPTKEPYFLYVGNAYPHKNVERMIESFGIFAQNNSQFTLKLVGREDYFYKKLKQKKYQNTEFVGYVSDAKLAKLYKNATATIIPSLMEGFGLTAVEAMKMNSVVLASNIPSLKEVCQKNAIYFNPVDPLSIAKAMQEAVMLSGEERKKVTQNALKHARIFSWEKTARITLDAYNSCL